jgi:hypothetical protein
MGHYKQKCRLPLQSALFPEVEYLVFRRYLCVYIYAEVCCTVVGGDLCEHLVKFWLIIQVLYYWYGKYQILQVINQYQNTNTHMSRNRYILAHPYFQMPK